MTPDPTAKPSICPYCQKKVPEPLLSTHVLEECEVITKITEQPSVEQAYAELDVARATLEEAVHRTYPIGCVVEWRGVHEKHIGKIKKLGRRDKVGVSFDLDDEYDVTWTIRAKQIKRKVSTND